MNKQCRNCKHWVLPQSREQYLKDYPFEFDADQAWLQGLCKRLNDVVCISCSGGWNGATVDSIETDANFSCAAWESKV